MSPLVSAPNRGYADWQRVSNYDTGSLFQNSFPLGNSSILSPVIDVSRYANLGLYATATAGQFGINMTWYLDAAGTVQVGTRTVRLDSNIPVPMQGHIPNMGPFVKFFVNPLIGGNFAGNINVWATNREFPIDYIPQDPLVLNQQNAAIGAGVTVNIYPTNYFAGPVMIWFDAPIAQMQIAVQALNILGTWDFINEPPATTAAAVVQYNMVMPPGAWRIAVANSGAATVFYLIVTPSITGAA